MEKKEYRMYCLVLKALSPMQKGIQALHSTVEFMNRFGCKEEAKQWAEKDKTVIVLDGGTVKDMTEIAIELKEHNIAFERFIEPDLGGLVTSISIVVSSDVYGLKEDEIEYSADDDEETYIKKWFAQFLSKFRLSR